MQSIGPSSDNRMGAYQPTEARFLERGSVLPTGHTDLGTQGEIRCDAVQPGVRDVAASLPQTANISALMGGLFNAPGRRAYRLVVADGLLVELSPLEMANAEGSSQGTDGIQSRKVADETSGEVLSRREAAALLGCSATYLCRHRKRLEAEGLVPLRNLGRQRRYSREDVLEFMEKRAGRRGPGRPRKVQ